MNPILLKEVLDEIDAEKRVYFEGLLQSDDPYDRVIAAYGLELLDLKQKQPQTTEELCEQIAREIVLETDYNYFRTCQRVGIPL